MKYVEIEFQNIAPLRIANGETSQNGQTNALSHISGSALRGVVIHALCQKAYFPQLKKALFSEKTHFMNAYLKRDGEALIPSFKGFYEDKAPCEGEKALENVVVAGKVTPGTKRAALGHYCYPRQDTLYYGDVAFGVDMNINRGSGEEKKNVFRSQYIQKGQSFVGYIALGDGLEEEFGEEIKEAFAGRPGFAGKPLDALAEEIQKVFAGIVYIGNSRHSGYGACRIIRAEVKEGIPYGKLRSKKDRAQFYLALLSHMSMRNRYGEPSGLDLEGLAKSLGCSSLRLVRCASSVTEVRGYNQSWKGIVPSVPMYEAGSVFCIETEDRSAIPADRFQKLEKEGLGVRRNEGFGQILIFDGYEALKKKRPLGKEKEDFGNAWKLPPAPSEDFWQDMKIAAKGLFAHRLERAIEKYVVREAKNLYGISSSQLGVVQSLCQELCYAPGEAKRQLMEYIRHSEEKENKKSLQDGKGKKGKLYRFVASMLQEDLLKRLSLQSEDGKLLGVDMAKILTEEDLIRYKLQLIVELIRYANREVKEYAD